MNNDQKGYGELGKGPTPKMRENTVSGIPSSNMAAYICISPNLVAFRHPDRTTPLKEGGQAIP